jgi:hypothetical protein
MVIVNESFGEAINEYGWPEYGEKLIGTQVQVSYFENAEEPSWHIKDTFWYVPERCLSPLKVEIEYV